MIGFQHKEKIYYVIRKHWFVFFLEIIGLIIAGFLPVFFAPVLTSVFTQVSNIEMMVVFFGSAWMLVLWMIFWVVFTNYYLDLLIITNLRLIDVEQLALFSRDVTSAPLANLEDVKIEVKGILATLIGYGNLHIQTAAAEKEVVMRGVKNPTEVKEMIMRLHHEAVRGNLDKGR